MQRQSYYSSECYLRETYNSERLLPQVILVSCINSELGHTPVPIGTSTVAHARVIAFGSADMLGWRLDHTSLGISGSAYC